jgi:hypothetical protein
LKKQVQPVLKQVQPVFALFTFFENTGSAGHSTGFCPVETGSTGFCTVHLFSASLLCQPKSCVLKTGSTGFGTGSTGFGQKSKNG